MTSGSNQRFYHKISAHPQANGINGVSNPVRDVHHYLNPEMLKRALCRVKRRDWHDWVRRAVHQQDWRLGYRKMGQLMGPGGTVKLTSIEFAFPFLS